jgi:hypothetical protein
MPCALFQELIVDSSLGPRNMMKYDEMDSFRMINPFLDVKNSSKPPVSKGPAHKSGALYDLYGTVGSVTSDFG